MTIKSDWLNFLFRGMTIKSEGLDFPFRGDDDLERKG
jgi:hypothetical protein